MRAGGASGRLFIGDGTARNGGWKTFDRVGWAGSIQFPNPVPDLFLCGLDSGDRFWQVTTRQAIRSPYAPVRGSAFTDCHRKRVRPLGSSSDPFPFSFHF